MKHDQKDPASQPERAKSARSRFFYLSVLVRVAIGLLLLLPATLLIPVALCLIVIAQTLSTLLMFLTRQKPPSPPSEELPTPAMWLRELATVSPTVSA